MFETSILFASRYDMWIHGGIGNRSEKIGFWNFSLLIACTALMAVIYTIVFRDDLGMQDMLPAILCRDSLLTDEDRKNINWDVIIRKGNHSKSTRIGWEIAILFIIGLTAGIVCTIKLIN